MISGGTAVDRKKVDLTLYQSSVLVLLCVLLVVGFFHYSALRTSQNSMHLDVQEIRAQYVQLTEYIKGQTQQDQEIESIKADLKFIKDTVRERENAALKTKRR